MSRILPAALALVLLMSWQATPALAAGLDRGDTAWMLTSTALVLMMTIPGLAMFYAGMVRKMNVLATMAQSFGVCCLVTVLWMIIGYSLAFTGSGSFIGTLDRVMLHGLTVGSISPLAGSIPESVYMCFQMTFAIITPALLTGAVADRMKFSAIMIFCGLWLVVVYSPIAHMVWGGGLLGAAGVLDYAGGTVVHINAGVAGLVACLVLGPRRGYGKTAFPPHNIGMSLVGAALLWVGWFGFNAGSAVAADVRAGMAMTTTQIATAAAALSWMGVEWALRKHPSVLGIISGAVAGLVAITPASGFVDPTGALVIGILAGALCFFAATTLKNKLGYDDSLDAFGVHAIGGIVGALLTGVFATKAVVGGDAALGWIDGNPGQIATQLYGIGVTIAYDAIASFVLLFLIDKVIGLRAAPEDERDGLDIALHGESVA